MTSFWMLSNLKGGYLVFLEDEDNAYHNKKFQQTLAVGDQLCRGAVAVIMVFSTLMTCDKLSDTSM